MRIVPTFYPWQSAYGSIALEIGSAGASMATKPFGASALRSAYYKQIRRTVSHSIGMFWWVMLEVCNHPGETGDVVMRSVVRLREDTLQSVSCRRGEPLRRLWNRRWLVVLAAWLISCLMIFSRRPDALLNPQFLAEDGTYFYAQAYNFGGLHALTFPIAGYLVTSARLAALIATFFPVSWGPAIFNVLGILIQGAPAAFLFTDRCDRLIPNWYARGAIAFLYLAIPSSFELDAAMTYSQWHLALLAFLVIVAEPPSAVGWKVFDAVTLVVAGLSGPFCILLAPVILLKWLRTRNSHLLRLFALDLFAVLAQAGVMLTQISTGRARGALGISPVELARIIAGQVFLAATFGMKGYAVIATTSWWSSEWFPILLAVAAMTFLGAVLPRAPHELQLLWMFAALVLVSSLFSPITNGSGTYWQRLAHPMWNGRYEFFLIEAWLVTLVWLVSSSSASLPRRVALIVLAFTCLIAIPIDWEYPAFKDYHYQVYVQRFERLPAGSRFVIPLNPPMEPAWTMTLIKR